MYLNPYIVTELQVVDCGQYPHKREKSKARGPSAEGKRQKPAYKQAGAKANSVGNWDGGSLRRCYRYSTGHNGTTRNGTDNRCF